jgi:putative addiction module component (TIGR02574 family)
MTARDKVLQDVLTLPLEDQLFVAEQLEERLDQLMHPAVSQGERLTDEDFAAEVRRRSEAYRKGETTAIPWEEFLAEQRRRQARGE